MYFYYCLKFQTEDQKTTKRKSTSNPFDVENQEEEGQPKPTNEQAVSAFHNIIGQCFLPYLYIYIDSLDRSEIDSLLIEFDKLNIFEDVQNHLGSVCQQM